MYLAAALAGFTAILAYAPPAAAGNAPAWMHALVNAPLPTHDEKTDAVLLYSETNVTVVSSSQIKIAHREAYKILRPEGRERGTVSVYLNSERKVASLHGWCIPPKARIMKSRTRMQLKLRRLRLMAAS